MKVELVVLNYNGGALFLDCLPSLVGAVRASRHDASLVILENGSNDGSDQEAHKLFPGIRLVRARENRILCSYNDYLRSSRADVAVLLNNDIKADSGFLDPLIAHFENDPRVFMVTPKCLSFDGSRYEGGITRFRMKFGIFWASSRYPGHERDIGSLHLTLAAGYGAFDRGKFLALGGYDDLYLPGRLEDTDLCFRAWKKGWTLLYEPSSVVYHKGGVSFHKRFGESGTLRINHRNAFLFIWKNIRDPFWLLSHLILLPFRLLFALVRGQREFVLGFFDALPHLTRALERRARLEPSPISDREIFAKV
jgi:GT2 family glycosyltransferase